MDGMLNKKNDEMEIDIKEIAVLLLDKIWWILIVTVLTAAIGFVVSKFIIAPEYQSTTSIYILNKQNGDSVTYTDTQLASQLTKDYETLIKGRYVLETVIAEQGLNMKYEGLLSCVTVKNATGTHIIDITVQYTDPVKAQILANAIREVASEHIKDVTNVEAITVASEANLPEGPCEPSVLKYTALGAAVGMIGCIGFIIARFLIDDTIKTQDDVLKYLDMGTLALIPMAETDKKKKNKKKKKPDAYVKSGSDAKTRESSKGTSNGSSENSNIDIIEL